MPDFIVETFICDSTWIPESEINQGAHRMSRSDSFARLGVFLDRDFMDGAAPIGHRHHSCDYCENGVLDLDILFTDVGYLSLCSVCRENARSCLRCGRAHYGVYPLCQCCTHPFPEADIVASGIFFGPENCRPTLWGLTHTACDSCGRWHENEAGQEYERVFPSTMLNETIGGGVLCDDCLENGEYTRCDNCGGYFSDESDDYHYDERREEYFCQSCYEDLFYSCASCSSPVHRHEMRESPDGQGMCSSCYNENVTQCYDCGDTIWQEDANYDDDGDAFCYECWRGRNADIFDYSYKPAPHFLGENNDFHMGFELEVKGDADGIANAVNSTFDKMPFYCKRDSSVDLEIVSHPGTLLYWQKSRKIDRLCEEIKSAGGEGYYTNGMSCGIHVHVSREGFSNADMSRVHLLVNRCDEQWAGVARRRSSYAEFNPAGAWARLKEMRGKYIEYGGNRYCAVNFLPDETFEFRIYRSTTYVYSVLMYLEATHAACTWARACGLGLPYVAGMRRWELWAHFRAHVRARKNTYPHFWRHLDDKKI